MPEIEDTTNDEVIAEPVPELKVEKSKKSPKSVPLTGKALTSRQHAHEYTVNKFLAERGR